MRLDRRLLTLAARDLPGPVLLVVLVGLATVTCWVAQALIMVHALVAVLGGASIASLVPLLVAFVAVVFVRAVLLWLREVVAQWAGLVIKTRLRTRLVTHLLDLGPAYTAGSRTGAVQSVLVDGVEGLEGYYARYLPQLVIAMIGPGAILVYLCTIDALVAAVVALFVVLVPVAPRMWENSLGNRARDHWKAYRELKSDYVDGMQGMTTLKSLGAADRYRDALHTRAWHLFRSTMRQLAASLVGTGLTLLMIGLGSAAAVAVGVVELSAGNLTAVGLLSVLLLVTECYRPFADLAIYWHLSYVGYSSAESIAELLDAQPLPKVPEVDRSALTPLHGRAIDGGAESSVELRGVDFGYPGRTDPVLTDFTMRIESGETVALIGSSGAGKTTVLSLLLRFYDPQQGSVRIGGVDVRELDEPSMRRLVTVVPQDPYLFHGTVTDNLRLGRPEATEDEVRAAAVAGNAAEFIERLPHGYDSVVDERGLTLSGGQRQRLAIARAVLRDAPVLVLDEATSNLDSESEALVHEALARLTRGRTTLMVTHRLATARHADRIVVLRGGQVVESGSHHHLCACQGDYFRLLELQGGAA